MEHPTEKLENGTTFISNIKSGNEKFSRKVQNGINLPEYGISFLVGAFLKKRARLLQSLVFFLFFYLGQTRSDER